MDYNYMDFSFEKVRDCQVFKVSSLARKCLTILQKCCCSMEFLQEITLYH